VEKFRRWSDCDGDVERRYTKDELLTHVMLYWMTGTIESSFLPYHDVAPMPGLPRGGHFAALEEPELLAQDIRAFFRPLRGKLAAS